MGNTKRWIMAACVLSLAGASMTACGQKPETKSEPAAVAEATETPEPTPEVKIAKEITKANDENTLVEKYGSIACRIKTYAKDGTASNVFEYHSDDYYYFEEGSSFVVDDGGDAYGFDEEAENPEYRYLFIGDSYEEFHSYNVIVGWDKDCEEDASISEKADEDGMLTVELSEDLPSDQKEDFKAMGYSGLKNSKLHVECKVDEVSYEIAEVKYYLRGKDGKDTLVQETTMLFDEKKPDVEQAYLDRVFSEDFRKVQVIVDPGSPKEQTYTQTVGKGCAVLAMLPADYDQNLYLDAACTEKMEGGTDPESDVVLYALSNEGGHGSTAAEQPEDSEEGSISDTDSQDSGSVTESGEMAQCSYCGRQLSIDESNGPSEYQQHVELEQRLETARIHLGDQNPLEIIEDDQYAEQCPWCENWYSTESADGVTSDYVVHVRWEKEYESVSKALGR